MDKPKEQDTVRHVEQSGIDCTRIFAEMHRMIFDDRLVDENRYVMTVKVDTDLDSILATEGVERTPGCVDVYIMSVTIVDFADVSLGVDFFRGEYVLHGTIRIIGFHPSLTATDGVFTYDLADIIEFYENDAV